MPSVGLFNGAVARAPHLPDKHLRWRTAILPGKRLHYRMFHTHRSYEGGICLDDDIVFLTRSADFDLGVEGVYFYLINDWVDARLRCHELFNLTCFCVSLGVIALLL